MSQINTLIKEKVVMKNVYFSTAHEAAKHIVQLLKDSAPSHNHFLIEVSFDQYEQVLEQVEVLFTMQTSINFDLKKGAFTYAQVRHIAEACCIHELHLLESGEITLDTTVLCMSSVIAFAQSKWNGADHQTAIKNAIYTAITIFGELFAEEVILQQLNELDQGKRFVASSVKSAVEKTALKSLLKRWHRN